MNHALTSVSMLKREAEANRHVEQPANQHGDECPVCGQHGAQEWLQGPDRFHGRRELYTLVRCTSCALVWLNCPPASEDMYLHYTDAYHKLISASGQNAPHRWEHRKAALTAYTQAGSLLDLGCSSGAFLESMRSDRWRLYGIEISAETARTAEARTGAKVFVGDVTDAPFAPASFDVITCFDVLEHVYDPRRVMAKVAYWLKPGGIFYVLVPNIDSAEARVFGSYWHGLELPRHLFHFSPASLRKLATSAGLSEVSLVTRRNPAVGTSLRYVWDDAFRAVGIRRTPVAYRENASLPWRVARKLVRMTALRASLAMAPLVGGGESIHAFFQTTLEPPVAPAKASRTI